MKVTIDVEPPILGDDWPNVMSPDWDVINNGFSGG